MLRQEQQLKPYRKVKPFEDMPLYNPEEELIPLPHALTWALIVHVLFSLVPVFILMFNPSAFMVKPPQMKYRDIEFVLVNQPEKDPIDKNTPFRSDKNSQAGGIHDPNKPISPPEAALPKSAPSQMGNDKKQKVKEEPAPKKIAQAQQPAPKEPKKEEAPKQTTKPAPKPPKVATRPSLPPSKSPNTMKLPVPPSSDAPKIAAPTGPVTSNPSGNYKGTSSSANPKPVIASGGSGSSVSGHGTGTKAPSGSGSGKGSTYSPGGGNAGNPGPGNPNGAPGVDAIKEPNFGPYMADLQRRIKANWDPPRGDESKRVVLLFRIAKDGRLLSVKVVKSSGSQAADRAALAAVELTAPFRALPSDYRGTDVDIQFTFDYNVFGVSKY